MRRDEFEHVVRAAAAIVEDEIVVIGSQAAHGQFAVLPDTLLVSRELDVYPLSAPERAAEIDGAIGDGSRFDGSYGLELLPETHREVTAERLTGLLARIDRQG
ncbi:MAG TPA: hypothetical protein VJ986_10635 [Gaiellaceae bacterium]|nr:hypothetical protein [Gaiellaceae bacterium]